MPIINQTFKIRDREINIPIVQGGMGIGVSLSNLATAVINEGGIGTISAAQPGFREPDFWKNYKASCEANYRALTKEINKVRANTNEDGFLAVNILCASRDYANLAKTAVANKADAIVSGAGLPLDLPKYTKGTTTANIPIVSSSRVLNIIMRKWQKKYDVIPDAIVVEGPKAGGHLGVKYEEIENSKITSLMERLIDVKSYLDKNDLEIPIIVAGGVYSNADIYEYLAKGASAVQLGTRFVATEECDAHANFKQMFIAANEEDVVYVKSPVGYPGRALRNNLTEQIKEEYIMPDKCIACVTPCKGRDESTPYCISERLSMAVTGEVEDGLVFSGANGYRPEEISTVHQVIQELLGRENE